MKIYVILIAMFLLKPLGAQDAYTLETCETDISENVPEFFQKYFHCVTARLSESGNYVNLYYDGTAPYESWYWEQGHPNNIDYVAQEESSFQVQGGFIEAADYVISIPVYPGTGIWEARGLTIDAGLVDGDVETSNEEYPMGSVGSSLSGVNMFNPCAAPGDYIEEEQYSFDYYNGHPAGNMGNYHYHTNSNGPLEVLEYKGLINTPTTGSAEIEVFGIMCDGVVVLGCTELDGSPPDPQTMDAQNGHVMDMVDELGVTMLSNRYHTHICYDQITDDDTDDMNQGVGNGYPDHEFTPEISYYKTPGQYTMPPPGQQDNDRCEHLSSPLEPDGALGLDDIDAVPVSFVLYDNYPNPFNPITVLNYDIPENSFVNVTIYNMTGRRVKTLVNANQSAGFKSVVWDATNFVGQPVATGVYFYRIVAGDFVQMKKMVFVK